MSKRAMLWLIPALLYCVFVFWYTDFGGALDEAEVGQFVATMTANGYDPDTIAAIEQFARQDNGRQFLMLNAIDLNENPPDVAGAVPGESAGQLMARYMEYMLPALLSRACHPVVFGTAVFQSMDLVGIEGADQWDQGALFRYRSRRSFLEIVTHPAFMGKHHFKTAALQKTIAYPIEPSLYLGDPRLLLGLILLAVTALIDGYLLSRNQARA